MSLLHRFASITTLAVALQLLVSVLTSAPIPSTALPASAKPSHALTPEVNAAGDPIGYFPPPQLTSATGTR